jgi:hypothetical protein
MPLPRIEEPTLYPPIVKYLQALGFSAVGNTAVVDGETDILFRVDSLSFIIEVKIGKPEGQFLLKSVAQAFDYAKELGTKNVIILFYPEECRIPITDYSIPDKIATAQNISALVLTEFWTESLDKIKITELFELLKENIAQKQIKVDFKTVVHLIENYVNDLNAIIYQIKSEELITEVVDKLDLFSAIGEIKDTKTAKNQVLNLASYLIFNQLLFYHVFKVNTKTKSLPELEPIEKVSDLYNYFGKITEIDYQSIYRVNISKYIPDKKAVIEGLNDIIKAINLLRAEHITHDLAGRFFHDLIPHEVRKVLAAFYTHPIAAEILAGLTIDTWDETVIDPACGSGTLLVSAYKRKEQLYNETSGKDSDKKSMHKRFIENDLTGIDIMPFAAHISAINLTMQNIEQKTNTIRIATQDSLELASAIRNSKFSLNGYHVKPYTLSFQATLDKAYSKKISASRKGSLSPEGKGQEFIIHPSSAVIMNPPFTDRDKMTEEMRIKLKNNILNEVCGNKINFWGYFLALSDLLLKPKGKLGAVIPVNLARGTTTEKIRRFFLENYHIKYVIKPIGDFAFSESSAFKDILFVAQKIKPTKKSSTTIVFVKKSIRDLSSHDAQKIVEIIKNSKVDFGKIYEDDYLQLKILPQEELIENIDNLMVFIGGTKFQNIDILRNFIKKSIDYGRDKLTNLDSDGLKEGITSPKGLGQLVYITVPSHQSRMERSFLILDSKIKDNVLVKPKDTGMILKIPNTNIKPALRTITGVKNINLGEHHYYIINKDYNDSKKVLTLSKWKGKFDWSIINNKIQRVGESRLVIPDKIRLSSKNTIMLAVYSETPLILSNLFFAYKDTNKEVCKTLSVSLNSIITLAQFLTLKAETLGGYIRLSANDWNLTFQLDYNKLDPNDKRNLLELFDNIKNIEFPSIVEQLESNFTWRVRLDKFVLHTLGFSDKEIDNLLPKIYDTLIKEFKAEKAMES